MGKKKKNILILFIIMIIIFIITIIVINRKSMAIEVDVYKGDYILNHDWVKFMELSDEEKLSYEIIPEKFIYNH